MMKVGEESDQFMAQESISNINLQSVFALGQR